MPTYDYKCEACGATFEFFQPMTAPPVKRCPTCGKAKVRRLIGGGAGLIFKGSGFYITDHRSESYKSAAKSDGGAKSDSSAGASAAAPTAAPAKTQSTPAAKADTK